MIFKNICIGKKTLKQQIKILQEAEKKLPKTQEVKALIYGLQNFLCILDGMKIDAEITITIVP